MHSSVLLAALLALSLAAAAQTTAPSPRQVTETTEDLDPATGKVVRRTTRTYDAPATGAAGAPTATAPAPMSAAPASDGQVSAFLNQKTVVSALTPTMLLTAYGRALDRVRNDRQTWKPADWEAASAVLSSLNGRYEQLRDGFSLDDKLSVRTQQAEFQALRTAQQISRTISDKL